MSKKVNLICGLDTTGRVYASIHQNNADEQVFVTFLTKLVETLQKENKDFRKDLVLVLDGCSFHRSPGTRLTLRRLGLTYAIAAPYAYDSQSIEYLFSMLKSTQMNPNREKTGKK